jgi:hypothetical protein
MSCVHRKTMREALMKWLTEHGSAIDSHHWQKGFAAIRVRCERIGPAAAAPAGAIATWCQKVWYELSEAVCGPDWRTLLRVGQRIPQAPQSGLFLAAQPVGNSGATTVATLPPTAKTLGLPKPSSWQGKIGGLLARGAEALRNMESGSLLGDALPLRGPPPAGFAISIPKVTRAWTGAKATSEPGREFPVIAQQESGCTITSQLYGLVEMREVDVDEASVAAEERLNNLGHELLRVGSFRRPGERSTADGVVHTQFFCSVEEGSCCQRFAKRTLGEWALRQTTTTDLHRIMSFEELEAQVRALSRLAGLNYDEATATIQRMARAASRGFRP